MLCARMVAVGALVTSVIYYAMCQPQNSSISVFVYIFRIVYNPLVYVFLSKLYTYPYVTNGNNLYSQFLADAFLSLYHKPFAMQTSTSFVWGIPKFRFRY